MNLQDQAKSLLTPDNLQALPELIGFAPEQLPNALEASIPAVLAIFHHSAQDSASAATLDGFLSETDPTLVDNPAPQLAESGRELLRSGKMGLARLLGPRLTDFIAPVAKQTGMGEGKAAGVLGALAPFVLSFLAKESSNSADLLTKFASEEPSFQAVAKAPERELTPEKNYLPDPNKIRERRPFPKRKAILFLLLFALLLLGAFAYLFSQELLPWQREKIETPTPQNLPAHPIEEPSLLDEEPTA